ncbi:hypothetical protein MesoLj131b_77190 (plasmid) [Mesorhizobium sp. 131-2-5]|nr:hypothetical protein MesoLj131b_77190 [Mesorhizobium sp. 131-2-5]
MALREGDNPKRKSARQYVEIIGQPRRSNILSGMPGIMGLPPAITGDRFDTAPGHMINMA